MYTRRFSNPPMQSTTEALFKKAWEADRAPQAPHETEVSPVSVSAEGEKRPMSKRSSREAPPALENSILTDESNEIDKTETSPDGIRREEERTPMTEQLKKERIEDGLHLSGQNAAGIDEEEASDAKPLQPSEATAPTEKEARGHLADSTEEQSHAAVEKEGDTAETERESERKATAEEDFPAEKDVRSEEKLWRISELLQAFQKESEEGDGLLLLLLLLAQEEKGDRSLLLLLILLLMA